MRSPIPDFLDETLDRFRPDRSGENADYIPDLAAADSEKLAICISTLDGIEYTAGDADHEFSIQSMSKPFIYGLALEQEGLAGVFEKVGVEPSGEKFNELSLDKMSGKPLNPMINAGAMTIHSIIGDPGASLAERTEIVRAGLSRFAGRELTIDENVADGEWREAYRNVAIANMLRSYDIFYDDPDEVVRGYIEQCSILVTVKDLAIMASTLAGGGLNPLTGEQVLSPTSQPAGARGDDDLRHVRRRRRLDDGDRDPRQERGLRRSLRCHARSGRHRHVLPAPGQARHERARGEDLPGPLEPV
jgi:glutaminase